MRKPFGYLLCGMVIGGSIGVMLAKRFHDWWAIPVGAILGVLGGIVLESYARRTV